MTEIDALWEYADPALSERRFRQALGSAEGDHRLELLTQIARTFSMRRRFDEAHALLDEVLSELPGNGPVPRVRYLLERGRTFNSSGMPDDARALFLDAWNEGSAAGLDGLTVDAAHMVAITHSGTDEAIAWNARGLDIARRSSDAKARALMPAMLNNSAWDLHDLGRFTEALPIFEEALAEWSKRGAPRQTAFAKHAVGRCLRSLGRHAEALAIHRVLEDEARGLEDVEGFVFEEIAENLAAEGATDDARVYFGKAAEALARDPWIAANEPARIESLKARASAPPPGG